MSDPLPADLASALEAAGPRLGDFSALHYVAEIGSTNDAALTMAARGAPEGTSVLADSQQAGRGRLGRSWCSPPGAGVYLSIVLRPGPSRAGGSILALAAGIGVARAIAVVSGLPVELKWPNDVVIGRPWRKLAGVLCELTGVGVERDAVVVGIGINVRPAAYPADVADRATSLETELGRPVNRAALVIECLAGVREVAERLRAGEQASVLQDWRQWGRSGLAGALVSWQDQATVRRGLARDIDENGALVVVTEGRVEHLVAGEVQWERLAHD